MRSLELDLVTLDQRVGEELLAHPLDLGARRDCVVGLDLQVDYASDAGLGDGEAELPQRALDGLALRIENPGLGANEDRRFHRSTASGSSTEPAKGAPVTPPKAPTVGSRRP